MTRLSVPGPQSGTGAAYEKFGLRNAASISVASAAVMVRVEDGICTDACVVIGAVAPIPMISEKSTALIKGSKVSELCEGSGLLSQIGAAAAADALPIDDIRGTAAYRRDLIKTLTQRAVLKAMDRANGEL